MASAQTTYNIGHQDLDVLVVGAGFAGMYQLRHLHKLGYKVLLVDNGSDYGGTWFWNRYAKLNHLYFVTSH
jgi:cation diffusion facilitator CzcD-associated flavoprotein CzcO